MRLIACRVHNVRRHRELELRFGRRLTLIAGANETGKSTLVEALHKALFLRATATGRGVEELRSRLHAGLPEVELSFEAAGEIWRLRKRFAGAGGTCQLSNSSGVALTGAEAEERLAGLLGFAAPVEGRRIAQLPERWAHLWVRQGDAGLNPFSGGPERYDHQRLVEQLQSSSSALQSRRDGLVLERLQQAVAEFFTATGRVKAGSPLALAQQRCDAAATALATARQHVAQLEAAMEQWSSINERLETIEGNRRPALQRELALEQQIHLLQARLEPLLLQEQERSALQAQQQQQQQEQHVLQQRIEALQLEQRQQLEQQQQLQLQWQQLNAATQQLVQRQELVQQLLDLQQLQAEEQQLREHQRELQRLQAEADTLKQQLAALPPISTEQVKQLRQAEQLLAQASTRCEAMAASVDVLASDQAVSLNGEALQAGERRRINSAAELRIGEGVLIQLSPGGGEALPQALEQQRNRQLALETLQRQLGISSSDQAEAIERQRQGLDRELANLRQAARAIPWSGLQERLAQLEPRRQRLERSLAGSAELLAALADEINGTNPRQLDQSALHALQDQLRSSSSSRNQEAERCQALLQELERSLQRNRTALEQQQQHQAQLQGSLRVLGERLQNLPPQPPNTELTQQRQELQRWREEQAALIEQRRGWGEGAAGDAAAMLQALEQEKDQLLSQRGQAEQCCQSLGATNPIAELEQRQVAWDEAEAERRILQRRAEALRLLLERFHTAQGALAQRYSEPLRAAICPYLAELASDPQQPLLGFDPQQGFHDLQLRQGEEAFAFERLSGGMREQLSAAVRLAMAEVLKPAYNNTLPLVFDDAFVNSDRERLTGLRRMLQRGLEQNIQLVLLSCHPEDYRALLTSEPGADTTNPPDNAEGMESVMVQLS